MYFYNYVTRSFTRMMLNSYCIGLGLSSLMDFMWFVLEGSVKILHFSNYIKFKLA